MVLLCTGLALVLLVVSYDGTLLPNDSAQYLSVASNLVDHEGLSTDLVFFMEHHVQATIPASETGFAPGYPLLVALPAVAGLSVPTAAFLVVALAFGLTTILLSSLVLSVTRSPWIATITALVWLTLVFNWFNAWERLSELPFIVCTLLATLLMPRSDDAPPVQWALVGAATAAAIGVRYAGTFFLVSVLIVLVTDLFRRRSRRASLNLLAYAVLPAVTIAGLLWRNYRIIGDVRGGNELYEATSVLEVLGRFAKALLHLSGYSRAGFAAFDTAEVSLLLAVSMTIALLIWQSPTLQLDRSLLRSVVGDRRIQVAAVYVLVSMVLLCVADMSSAMKLQARMLLVLVPFVLLLAGSFISVVVPMTRSARAAVVLSGVLLGLAYWIGQVQVVDWQHSRPNLYSLTREALEVEVGEGTATEYLQQLVSVEHPLLGNEPQMLGAVVAGPVVGLPPVPYSDIVWDFDAVRSVVERYGIEYVVFMPRLQRFSSERVRFFDDLGAGVRPTWLKSVVEVETLELFRVSLGDP